MEMTNNRPEVAVVGAAFMDLQVYPVNKTLLDTASYSAERMVWSVGGDAINESTILTRMGHQARLISCMGDDMIGRMVLEHCGRNGIDTSRIKQDPGKTTSINIGLIGEDAERTFITNRSGSIWTIRPEDIDITAIDGAKILSFASIFNTPCLEVDFMIRLFERAKQQGMIICADVVAPKKGETLQDVAGALPYIDYFFPNLEEARRLTGKEAYEDIADSLLEKGIGTVVLKTGKKGCLVKNAGTCFTVSGYPASKAIDTTGAGDNFASGFISALLESRPLACCAQYANCTASIAVEAVGATEGVKSREQVEERYRSYLDLLPEERDRA